MIEILPAVLPETYDDLCAALGRLSGGRTLRPLTVQIDVCDGLFVTNRTWPFNPADRAHFAEIVRGDAGLPYWQDFTFEIDLMAHQPERHLSAWIAAGASRAIVHLESRHDFAAVKDAVGESLELGLAIDLDPPWERLEAYLPQVDFLQLMGIRRLGKQGTDLDERIFDHIRSIRARYPDGTIQIDGGVSLENARALIDAGADRLVVGSRIIGAPDPRRALADFQTIA